MIARLAIEAVPSAILVYDRTAVVVEANQACAELLGVTREQLVGSAAEDSEWLVTDAIDGPLSVHPAIAALKSRQPVRGVLVLAPAGGRVATRYA